MGKHPVVSRVPILWSAMLGSKAPPSRQDGRAFSTKMSSIQCHVAARVRVSAGPASSYELETGNDFINRLETGKLTKPLKSCLKVTRQPEHRGPKSSPRVRFSQELIDELNLKALSAMDFCH